MTKGMVKGIIFTITLIFGFLIEVEAADEPSRLALSVEAINELEAKQRQLDEREKALAEQAEAIIVQEKILKEKMRRIDDISKKMAERLDGFKSRSQEKIFKLVSIIEEMKSDAAARFFEFVDPNLAVEVLTRIDVKRASKILNKLDKERSARLSELYTGYRSKLKEVETEVSATHQPAS